MFDVVETDISCGIHQIYDLSREHKEEIADLFGDIESCDRDRVAYYVFSDNTERGNGESLKKFINKNKLGKCVATPARKNPNSGSMIKLYVWAPDYAAIEKFCNGDEKFQFSKMSLK